MDGSQGKIAVIVGASGAVGQHLVHRLSKTICYKSLTYFRIKKR